jgi:cytidine deaminase
MSVVTAPEFNKLVTLARGARGRVGAAEGAAVLDEMGRSYTGCTVTLPTLSLSAIHLAVATAVASGSRGLDAVVVVSDHDTLEPHDVKAIRDFGGPGVPITVVDDRGAVVHEAHT